MSEVKRCSDSELEQYLAGGIAKLQADYDALRAENERLSVLNSSLEAEARRLFSDYQAADDEAMTLSRKLKQSEAELAALKAVPDAVDEREAFERWWSGRWLPEPLKATFFMAWQARAALSAPAAGQDVVIKMVMALKDIESASCTDSRSVLIARAAIAAHKAGGGQP